MRLDALLLPVLRCYLRQLTQFVSRADTKALAGRDFALLYGVPNFLFHVSSCHATLRKGGVAIGKGDFDGFHHYPPGTSLV